MTGKQFRTLMLAASFVGSVGLVGAPFATSLGWAVGHDRIATPSMAQGQRVQKSSAQVTPAVPTGQPMPRQAPQTLEGYVTFIHDTLQHQASQIKQPGTVDLKLTIGKDGSVQRTEIVRLDGPATLRDQIMAIVSQLGKLPPLPADANADVLVVTTVLAFNYPGADLLDPFGQGRRGS